MNIELDQHIPIPESTRGRGGIRYPFNTMAVGDSFHILPTQYKPNPVRAMASTVCSANKRCANMHFIVRHAGVDDPRGPGARIFRVE